MLRMFCKVLKDFELKDRKNFSRSQNLKDFRTREMWHCWV